MIVVPVPVEVEDVVEHSEADIRADFSREPGFSPRCRGAANQLGDRSKHSNDPNEKRELGVPGRKDGNDALGQGPRQDTRGGRQEGMASRMHDRTQTDPEAIDEPRPSHEPHMAVESASNVTHFTHVDSHTSTVALSRTQGAREWRTDEEKRGV
jgi:hypothetical protein